MRSKERPVVSSSVPESSACTAAGESGRSCVRHDRSVCQSGRDMSSVSRTEKVSTKAQTDSMVRLACATDSVRQVENGGTACADGVVEAVTLPRTNSPQRQADRIWMR